MRHKRTPGALWIRFRAKAGATFSLVGSPFPPSCASRSWWWSWRSSCSLQRGVCRFQIMVLVNNSAHNAHQLETFKEGMKCLCQYRERTRAAVASDVNVSAERLSWAPFPGLLWGLKGVCSLSWPDIGNTPIFPRIRAIYKKKEPLVCALCHTMSFL